jgi:hypothetical protein
MGLFSKKPQYPELDAANPAAGQVDEIKEPLKNLMDQVSDPLEVIPADDSAYIYIGKPPKKFGLAMIEEGEVQSLVAVAQEKGLDQPTILKINEKLRDAYKNNEDAERYVTRLAGKDIVVTPSAAFGQEVREILSQL